MAYDNASDIQAETLRGVADLLRESKGKLSVDDLAKMFEAQAQKHVSYEDIMTGEDRSARRLAIADRVLADAIQQRIKIGNAKAVEALQQLVCWVPGYYPDWPLIYASDGTAQQKEDEHKRCDESPMCTEVWTYELFGKEQARTFLGLVRGVAAAVGVDSLHDLMDEKHFHGENHVDAETRKEWARRKALKELSRKVQIWWDEKSICDRGTAFDEFKDLSNGSANPVAEIDMDFSMIHGVARRKLMDFYQTITTIVGSSEPTDGL